MKQATYIKALKELPDYFIDDQTRFAVVDDTRMVVANPRFAAMWYDGGRKKPRWKMVDHNSPFFFEGKQLKVRE